MNLRGNHATYESGHFMTLNRHHTRPSGGLDMQTLRGAVAAIILALTPWAAAHSATITVNSLLGAATANGLCELSEALQASETNLAVDGCAAGAAGADTIGFAPSLFASGSLPKLIDLGAGYVGNVREPMTLLGPGADKLTITVSSGANNAAFRVGQSTAVVAPSYEISGVTFSASSNTCIASLGGLLYVHDVVFESCLFGIDFGSNQSATANTLTVRSSLFKNGSGSALAINGPPDTLPRLQVLIDQSIITAHFGTSSNSLISIGGGFDATFQNVEISSNAMLGTALINFGNGADNNSVSMRNVTIANNASNAVGSFATILAQRSTLDFSNSTLVNNTAFSNSRGMVGGSTGGLYSIASTVNIISSVVANNTFNGSIKAGDYYKHDGASIVNVDHSLLRNPFGVTVPLLNVNTNNLAPATNPQLGTLTYGGFAIAGTGYTVRSIPVQAGSALIGAGINPLGLVNDMRGSGFPRMTASGVTIGAVQEGTPTVFNFATSTASGNEGTSVVLTVNRTGSLAAAATVQCVTGLGSDTAVANLDYTSVSATLTWAANDGSAKTCTVPLLTDTFVEGPEIVTVRLQNPTPLFDSTTQTTSAIGSLSAVTVTIIDVVVPTLVQLTVTKSGTGAGAISSSPTGINCGSTCSASFTANTVVMLTATATIGSTFSGWSGACTGAATCLVTLDVAKNVDAAFALIPLASVALTVSKSGAGAGAVTSSPTGINCGVTCSASFTANTVVTLTATATSGSTFSGWTGACTGAATCVVTMDIAKSVDAAFASIPPASVALTISKSGSGTGTVASSPTGISCGTTCSASFNANTVVTLAATAASGSAFSGWSGACTGTATCVVTMDTAKSVGAAFALSATSTSLLTITKAGTGSGTVTSSPTGINCGATCSAPFTANAVVTLTAAAAAGASVFSGWTGACTGTGSCSVTMDAAKSVGATFDAVLVPPVAAPALPVPTLYFGLVMLLACVMVSAVRIVSPTRVK